MDAHLPNWRNGKKNGNPTSPAPRHLSGRGPLHGILDPVRAWDWLQKSLRLTILFFFFAALPSGDILHLGLAEGAALGQLSDTGHSGTIA